MKEPYSPSFREKMVQRMLGPTPVAANRLAKEVGLSPSTLSRWLRQAHLRGMKNRNTAEPPPKSSGGRSADDKLRVVLSAEHVAPDELGAFLRREGVHESELAAWRAVVTEAATEALSGATKAAAPRRSTDSKRIKELERELRRKDKALAETAALLVLAKKVQQLWGDEDDATDSRSDK